MTHGIGKNNEAGAKPNSDRGRLRFVVHNGGRRSDTSSDIKLKDSRGKKNQIGKEVEVNNDYPSATAGGKAHTFRFSHDENAI